MPMPPAPSGFYTPTASGGLCATHTKCLTTGQHGLACKPPTDEDKEYAAMFGTPPCKEALYDGALCGQPLPCPEHGLPRVPE